MKFAAFNVVQGGMREAGSLGKLGIRHCSSPIFQIFGQLLIKVFSHPSMFAKIPSRMRDDVLDMEVKEGAESVDESEFPDKTTGDRDRYNFLSGTSALF